MVYRSDVVVSIVTVSIVFHLTVRFASATVAVVREVGCGYDRFRAVDCGVFAEEVGVSGCGVGYGHAIAASSAQHHPFSIMSITIR